VNPPKPPRSAWCPIQHPKRLTTADSAAERLAGARRICNGISGGRPPRGDRRRDRLGYGGASSEDFSPQVRRR